MLNLELIETFINSECEHGMLTGGSICFGLIKNQEFLFVFNSYGCTEMGNISINRGNACCLKFNLVDLGNDLNYFAKYLNSNLKKLGKMNKLEVVILGLTLFFCSRIDETVENDDELNLSDKITTENEI